MRASNLFEKYADGREVHGRRHDVIRHLAILHASVLLVNFFVEREADRLRHASGNLPGCENRVKHLADFLYSDEIFHGHAVGGEVDFDLRNVNGPGKCRIGFAAVFLVIPENAAWGFVTRVGLEGTARGGVFTAGSAELRPRISVSEQCASAKGLL